jgi:hypothetical protein
VAADFVATGLRAGAAARSLEPRALPLLAAVASFAAAFAAFPPVAFAIAAVAVLAVFTIAIPPLPQRSCFEKTN